MMANEKELHRLLVWVQKRIKINRFDVSLWNKEHTETVFEFFKETSIKSLFATVDTSEKTLIVCTNNPPAYCEGRKYVAFFIRSQGADLTESTIDESVIYGTCAMEQTATSLMKIMENVFKPFIFDVTDWNPSTTLELTGLYHRLMASLTESASEENNKTMLYIPFKQKDRPNVHEYSNNKELIQQLESIAIHWTRQIKSTLANYEQNIESDEASPMSELSYWRSRAIDLHAISQRFTSCDVMHILRILESVHSKYCEPIKLLSKEIGNGAKVADNNVKFLKILQEPCQNLSNARFEEIQGLFPRLLACTRAIYTLSENYNTYEKITGLLRKICNEIIRRCRGHISLSDVFQGDVEESMQKLHDCINCCKYWKNTYNKTAISISKSKKRPNTHCVVLKMDDSSVFAKIDAFMQRCDDLIEICEGRKQFILSTCFTKSDTNMNFKGTNEQIRKNISHLQ